LIPYTLTDGVENLKMIKNLKNGIGNKLNNRITGDTGANLIKGDFGDDFLDGSGGKDSFDGGYGDDTFVVDVEDESIKEDAGQGNDWVQSDKISIDLNKDSWGGNIENARLTGKSNLNISGLATNNYLVGNDGANVLDGFQGVDTLVGGLGDDIYRVDTTTDTILEGFALNSKDTIQASIDFTLNKHVDIENLTLTANTAAINGTGNTGNNAILGNEKNNVLSGLEGNDTLNGGGGADSLQGGKGDDVYQISNDGDVVQELLNEGVDTIEIGTNYSLTSVNNIENLTLVGTIAANAGGTNEANILVGNEKANTLTGLDGTDRLKGGEDADILIGGLGADVLDLTESKISGDKLMFAFGAAFNDSAASVSEADKVVKFGLANDTIHLSGTIKIAANANVDGFDVGGIKSHLITNGVIRFDDIDTYTEAGKVGVTLSNISGVIDYLKTNITGGSIVAFLGTAPDPNSPTAAAVNSTWIFQDNGTSDTLIALVGITTATSLSTGAFSTTAIHLA